MEGFIQEEETSLPPNMSFERSNVFSVARREGEREWETVFFVREHLVDLEKKIMKELWTNPKKSMLYVQGSPGCGKTCVFYLWARICSVKENKRVLIVQFREMGSCFIWIREVDGALWRMKKGIDYLELRVEVKAIIDKNEATPFDLCIHDGVLDGKDICTSMLSLLNTAVVNGVIKKVIHVTSLAFSLSTGGQLLDSSGPIVELSVDSWRLQDYIEAITCQEFAKRMIDSPTSKVRNDKKALENNRDDDGTEQNSTVDASDKIGTVSHEDKEANNEAVVEDEVVDDKVSGDGDTSDDVAWTDVIETKYYYAGGSARFMFDFHLSELRSQLDVLCNKVRWDEWKDFAHGAVASGTPVAVNTLMQQFEGKTSPVSKYILFRAYEKCKTELVNAVKAAANAATIRH